MSARFVSSMNIEHWTMLLIMSVVYNTETEKRKKNTYWGSRNQPSIAHDTAWRWRWRAALIFTFVFLAYMPDYYMYIYYFFFLSKLLLLFSMKLVKRRVWVWVLQSHDYAWYYYYVRLLSRGVFVVHLSEWVVVKLCIHKANNVRQLYGSSWCTWLKSCSLLILQRFFVVRLFSQQLNEHNENTQIRNEATSEHRSLVYKIIISQNIFLLSHHSGSFFEEKRRLLFRPSLSSRNITTDSSIRLDLLFCCNIAVSLLFFRFRSKLDAQYFHISVFAPSSLVPPVSLSHCLTSLKHHIYAWVVNDSTNMVWWWLNLFEMPKNMAMPTMCWQEIRLFQLWCQPSARGGRAQCNIVFFSHGNLISLGSKKKNKQKKKEIIGRRRRVCMQSPLSRYKS